MANGDDEPLLDVGGRVHPRVLEAIRNRLFNTEAWSRALPGTAAGPFVKHIVEAGPRLTQQVVESGYAGTPMTPEQIVPGAADVAGIFTGMGTPFSLAGAVGSAGGKLTQPALRVRAPASEIERAAAESPGMTQRELRELYDELGLTGLPPSLLAKRALASQPSEAIAAAQAMKQEDMAALNRLSPEERKLFVQGKLKNFTLPSQEAAEPAAKAFEPIKKEVKKAEIAFDKLRAEGTAPSLFDLSAAALTKVPEVEQFNLPRAAPKITERIKPAFEGEAGLGRIESAAANASPADFGWYNLDQVRRDFHTVHGPQKGEAAFQAWLDALAGTSMVNPISSNVRSSTDYFSRIMQGRPLPETVGVIDPITGREKYALAGAPSVGYGAKAQQQHADRVREFLANKGDPVANPKPFSYRQDLGGNWMPRTVDTHDIRNMLGMPYSLGAVGENAGLLPGEYAALEQLGQKAATRAGVPQAAQQAATWIGGADYTKLKSIPIPLLEEINRRIHVTAAVTGQKPQDLWRRVIQGKTRLLGIGGAGVALPGLLNQPPEQY